MNLRDIEQHNKKVEAERKAYHEKRCAESENYKRVYENMNKIYMSLRQQQSEVQSTIANMKSNAETLKLTEAESISSNPKTGANPKTSVILENFGFMIIAGFFGTWLNVPLNLEHFKEDKPYYEEYFKVETEFNKRIILPEQPDR